MQKNHHTRRVLCHAVAALVLVAAAPTTLDAQETQDTMKLSAPMREARAALSAGYVALDPGKVKRLYADSAVVNFQDQTYSGRHAVDGWIVESMQGLSSVRFGAGSFTIGDNEFIERNTYRVTLGDGTQVEGTSEAVWRRQPDGSWKVVRLSVT